MKYPTQLRALEVGYGLLGLVLTGWAIVHTPTEWYLPALWLIMAAAALTPYSIRLNDPVRLPGAMPLEMAVLLLAPPAVSVLVAASTNLFTSIRFRRPILRTFFNVANLAIPNGLAALVLLLMIEPWPGPIQIPMHLAPIALAILVRMVTNLLGIAGLLYLEGKISRYWSYIKATLVDEWRSGGFGIRLLPVLVALTFQVAGWWALLLGALLQMAIGGSMQRYQERIDRQTLLDGLTGLSNRRSWDQYVRLQENAPQMVAVIDVNGLKRTNDTYGHHRGDEILVDLAQRLLAVMTRNWQGSRVFRVGGDEFVAAVPGTASKEDFRLALEEVGLAYTEHWASQGVPASISVGLASVPQDALSISGAFTVADQRMYRLKSGAKESILGASD
ncbi:MAG: GGDEF domain-containing protein [Bacillota bacterium]